MLWKKFEAHCVLPLTKPDAPSHYDRHSLAMPCFFSIRGGANGAVSRGDRRRRTEHSEQRAANRKPHSFHHQPAASGDEAHHFVCGRKHDESDRFLRSNGRIWRCAAGIRGAVFRLPTRSADASSCGKSRRADRWAVKSRCVASCREQACSFARAKTGTDSFLLRRPWRSG